WCVCLPEDVERQLHSCMDSGDGDGGRLPPELSQDVSKKVLGDLELLTSRGCPPVVLCAPRLRRTIRGLLATEAPDAAVLGYDEVDSVEVQSVNTAEVHE
ncbi:MAG: FHIPEP family type III secretion protein, partial [Planctomycetota bacterium]